MSLFLKLFLAPFLVMASHPPKSDLSLNLKIGETYTLEFSNTTVSSVMDLTGDDFVFENEQTSNTSKLNFKVENFENGVYDFTCSYEEMSFHTSYPDNLGSVNTQHLEKDDFILINEVLHKPFRVHMTEKGKIVAVQGIEDIYLAIISNEFGDIGKLEKHRILFLLQDVLNEEVFSKQLEMATFFLPEKDVSPGNSWKHTSTYKEGFMETKTKSKYSFENSNTTAHILYEQTKIKKKGVDENPEDQTVAKIIYDIGGTIEATIYIDKESNWIQHVMYKTKMSGEIKMNMKKGGENKTLPFNLSEFGSIH